MKKRNREMKKPILLSLLGILLVSSVVGLFTGCGDMPTAPGNGGDGSSWEQSNGGVHQSGLAGDLLGGAVNVVLKTVEKVIGVLGGTLDLTLDSGPTRLAIPAGALDGPVAIKMSAEQKKTWRGYYTEFDFGPDGLVFNKPSSLSLTLPYPDGKMVACYWYNPSTGKWDWQESQPVKNNKVVFSILHFSKYGIS